MAFRRRFFAFGETALTPLPALNGVKESAPRTSVPFRVAANHGVRIYE
jgi:hypothetical protein